MDNKTSINEIESEILNSRELYDAFYDLAREDTMDEQQRDKDVEDGIDPDTEEDLLDESDLSYEEGLDDGLSADKNLQPNISEVIVKKREDTRSTLAIIYVIATFLIFFTAMAIAVLDGLNRNVSIIDNLTEVIPLLSGVFLGTLGFVLGYYFRKSDDNNEK